MSLFSSKYVKIVSLFLISVFVTAAVFGIWHTFGMQMNSQGKMNGCPFMGQTGICTMTFAQHLTRWQNMFASTPAKAMILSFVLLAIGLLILGSVFLKKHFIWALERMAALQKLYLVHHPHLSLFNSLREAFSQGILNPKIY